MMTKIERGHLPVFRTLVGSVSETIIFCWETRARFYKDKPLDPLRLSELKTPDGHECLVCPWSSILASVGSLEQRRQPPAQPKAFHEMCPHLVLAIVDVASLNHAKAGNGGECVACLLLSLNYRLLVLVLLVVVMMPELNAGIA
jgi:hypothetical protein